MTSRLFCRIRGSVWRIRRVAAKMVEGFVEDICVCEDDRADDKGDACEAEEGWPPIPDEPVVNSERSAHEAAVGFIRIRQLRLAL